MHQLLLQIHSSASFSSKLFNDLGPNARYNSVQVVDRAHVNIVYLTHITIINNSTIVMRINGMSAIPPPGFSRSDMNDDMIYLYVWIKYRLCLVAIYVLLCVCGCVLFCVISQYFSSSFAEKLILAYFQCFS